MTLDQPGGRGSQPGDGSKDGSTTPFSRTAPSSRLASRRATCSRRSGAPLGGAGAQANDGAPGARCQPRLPTPAMVVAMATKEKPERRAVVVGVGVVVVGRIAVVDPVAPTLQIASVPPAAAAPVHLVNV